MPRRLALILALLAPPVAAQDANLAPVADAVQGAASQLVLAHRVYRAAGKTGDPVLLLSAIRLARGVVQRPALAWERADAEAAEEMSGPVGPPDPASPAALAVLQGLVTDDPDLQDLVYDLDAQVPPVRLPVATVARAAVAAGEQDEWRLPLSGAVAAEIALIGDGAAPLSLSVTDEAGATLCTRTATSDPTLCRFTPARNGFFTVRIGNSGTGASGYLLVGN